MYSNRKWISNLVLATFALLAWTVAASAQVHIIRPRQSFAPPDEARDIFISGQKFYDEYRFGDAENKFREVIRRFPKNPIADRADYYLIRTLAQVGKKSEAVTRINLFGKQYPKSKWLMDVQELQIQLTNQIPARAESILRISIPAPGAQTPSPFNSNQVYTAARAQGAPAAPLPAAAPRQPILFSFPFQNVDPEVSLQQEIMRAMFRNNVDRAIEIAGERLKANPADPVVLSSLNLVAGSRSAQAASMLLAIVKGSPNPRARRDAIYWLGQSNGDRDVTVDTLVGLLPSLSDDDSEAVTYALSQMRTDKATNALATIARDKAKNEKVRNNALYWIGQSRITNRVPLLEDIYKNSMDNSRIRQQAVYAMSQIRDPQAVTIIGNVASSDPDVEVRKQAVYWLGQRNSPEANQVLERLLQRK
jgi:TolA-binding protein